MTTNPNGDRSFQHAADTTTTTDTSNTQREVDGTQTKQPPTSISEAKRLANKANAKKSTGPKTARGKKHSRRNAVKHGLLSKKLLFSDEGWPINPELHQLWEDLHEKYDDGDIRTHLLADGLVVELWRQRQALMVEVSCYKSLAEAQWHYGPQGTMSNLQRYSTASQRAVLKNLELLEQQPPSVSESEEEETEGEPATPQPENPQPSGGLTLVANEQRPPECDSQSHNEAGGGNDAAPSNEAAKAA